MKYNNNIYNKTLTDPKINLSNYLNIMNNKIYSNNNISNINKNNMENNINQKNNDSIKPFNLMKKELALNMKLMKKAKQQKKNIVLNIEKEFDIMNTDKKRNNSKDEQKSRVITLAKPFDPYKYVHEINNNENDNEANKKKIMLIIPEKKQKKVKEISPNYIDERENENTIIYKNKTLKMINIDLLLRNIITSDFMKIHINYIFHFSQQCFCFIPKEILFQKIINCYEFFKKLNTPFVHLKKIIYFLDLLIIEMYEYYHSVPVKELSSIKKFYNNLENEIKKILGIKKTGTLSNGLERDNKKFSNKMDEKLMLMGKKMIDRLKSNPNMIYEKGKIKEETNSITSVGNINKKEKEEKEKKDIKNKDEQEILEEIKQIQSLFSLIEPNNNLIIEIKKKINFYNLKSLIDSKKKKSSKKPSSKRGSLQTEKIIKKNVQNYFSILDWEPKDIGEVLISISKRYLIKIERKELYKAIFLKNLKNKTCPNIMECINKFNKLTSFIMEEILSYDLPKERAKIIEGWVKVAEYLKLRKDHNDCVAIYSALKHYIITGLSLTLKELKSKTKTLIKEISEYCTFEGNYKNLREEIINCIDYKEFYIPYLGMLLRDISFYEANYEYLINGNLINMEKIEKVQIAIENFFYFKNIPDIFNKNNEYPQTLYFFNDLELIKEDDLDILANKLEPKYILGDMPQKIKRLTNIDKIYYSYKSNNITFIKLDKTVKKTFI